MADQKTILLIDDEVDLQQLVKIALKSHGYEVVTANNGLEGLEVLKNLSPHLIILDMNMPKMGGLEFYQKICDANNQPIYPVLVLTARTNMEHLFKEFNIDGFMSKPFEIDGLLTTVDAIIQKQSYSMTTVKLAAGDQPRKVCIVEDGQEAFNKIGSAFLNAGYVVNPARSGIEAIERISAIVPDVALVKLGLVDIAGDIVILKLKRMAKTQFVKYVLYTEKATAKVVVTDQIRHKEGIDYFVTLESPEDLVNAVADLFKTKK